MHHPRRGDRGAYERYLDGMDATMRQKVALTAAHFLFEGRVADLGMGSGTGSYALAALYPALEVVGVDLDPEMVRIAAERYRLPNLSFVEGDIAGRFFPPRHLDGILLSSVLHHVTTFGGYTHDNARAALDAAASQLKPHGVVVVRDFVALDGRDVWLDLDTRDGDESDDPSRCSSAALLERFAGEFRRGIDAPRKPGFALACVDVELSREAPAASDGAPGSDREENGPSESRIPPLREGFRRYRLALRHALEFVLRKDYRESWANEVLEEYTYFTQAQFESCFAALGLRVLASTPIYNPWIER
ncbi:MAG: methyltransferase domain-containing protein, partial [Myxococcales bacterium]|nr:methyltransferase domain-containing protein [Myxococcales bacterium]